MFSSEYFERMSVSPGSVTATLLVGLVVYILTVVLREILRQINLRKTFSGLPEPGKRHWLYGHLHLLPEPGEKLIRWAQETTGRLPRIYCFWTGPLRPSVMLNHPETVSVLLKTAEPKPVQWGGAYRHALPWLGEGLLLAGGAKWARSRRLLTPAFHFDILRPYQAIYNEAADLLLENIDKYADSGESFEVFQLISAYTLDVMLRCAFSYETDCQKNISGESHPYCKAVGIIAKCWAARSRSPWLFPDTIFYLTSIGREFSKNCDYVHKVADDIIKARRKVLETEDISKKKCLDFLDILLTAKDDDNKGLTEQEIRNEVDTFLFEGHDTTASALSWTLYSLSKEKDYQNKCQEEVDSVLSSNNFVKWEDLSKFEYLTMCIKEGMRLHSPVPFIQRRSTKEVEIDGYRFPPGTNFSISLSSVHINPTVWKEPDKYDPERFSKENIMNNKGYTYSFVPFSAGPRNCIGQNFAMNEEKTVLTRILKRYELTVDPNHTVERIGAAVRRAKNGIKMFAKRR